MVRHAVGSRLDGYRWVSVREALGLLKLDPVEEFYAKPRPFIGALEALGLLKLDTPESVHQEGVDFIMARHASWQSPEVVAEDLAKYGFVLARSWRR